MPEEERDPDRRLYRQPFIDPGVDDDASEWEGQEAYLDELEASSQPITLESLLEFLARENPDAEDSPELVDVEELLARYKKSGGRN